MTSFRPIMLAETADLSKLAFPLVAQPTCFQAGSGAAHIHKPPLAGIQSEVSKRLLQFHAGAFFP